MDFGSDFQHFKLALPSSFKKLILDFQEAVFRFQAANRKERRLMSGLFFLFTSQFIVIYPFQSIFHFQHVHLPFFASNYCHCSCSCALSRCLRHFILMQILIRQMKLKSKSMSSALQMSATALPSPAGEADEGAKASGMSAECRSHFSRHAETLGRRRSGRFLSFLQLLSTYIHIYFLLFVN